MKVLHAEAPSSPAGAYQVNKSGGREPHTQEYARELRQPDRVGCPEKTEVLQDIREGHQT